MAGSSQNDPYIESPFDRIVDVHWGGTAPGQPTTYGVSFGIPVNNQGGDYVANHMSPADVSVPKGSQWEIFFNVHYFGSSDTVSVGGQTTRFMIGGAVVAESPPAPPGRSFDFSFHQPQGPMSGAGGVILIETKGWFGDAVGSVQGGASAKVWPLTGTREEDEL
jgi:hypothetical protein